MSFPYIPLTDGDKEAMLKEIGVSSTEELFSDVPSSVVPDRIPIADGITEFETERYIRSLAQKNRRGVCFLGFGSYDHIIPAAVTALANNPAFVTAYTPYQPEISQGVLEGIFEYQSMVCELTGLPVSNASLYDGASACVEACALALADKRKSTTCLVSETLHPFYIETLKAWALGTDRKLVFVPENDGLTDFDSLDGLFTDETAVFIAQSPNKYGYFEDFSGVADKVHSHKALFAISSDPMSLALQKSQGEWGADIAVGDMQSFGLPVSFGGPYCGYMAVSSPLMRKIPGRIVGRTVDRDGKESYVLTLQAREQHIKRERATSNICSNEALAALTSVIYASEMGWKGIAEAAKQSYAKAHYLYDSLGLSSENGADFFLEFPIPFESDSDLDEFVAKAEERGIFAGVKIAPGLLLTAVTEKRTKEELDAYISLAREAMK